MIRPRQQTTPFQGLLLYQTTQTFDHNLTLIRTQATTTEVLKIPTSGINLDLLTHNDRIILTGEGSILHHATKTIDHHMARGLLLTHLKPITTSNQQILTTTPTDHLTLKTLDQELLTTGTGETLPIDTTLFPPSKKTVEAEHGHPQPKVPHKLELPLSS